MKFTAIVTGALATISMAAAQQTTIWVDLFTQTGRFVPQNQQAIKGVPFTNPLTISSDLVREGISSGTVRDQGYIVQLWDHQNHNNPPSCDGTLLWTFTNVTSFPNIQPNALPTDACLKFLVAPSSA